MITFPGRVSVSRESLDAVIFDEGIASAIAEEKSAADEPLAGDRKLTGKVIKAENIKHLLSCFHRRVFPFERIATVYCVEKIPRSPLKKVLSQELILSL